MPPEPTKGKLRRKTSRNELDEYRFDGRYAREIEDNLKRNNGQISCTGCKRLKIKCDKQIPCQPCQRRGRASFCSRGVLATGQGTRFVLAGTEHHHLQRSKMSERIRLLEDALGELQSQLSTEPHPLLRDDLLGVNQKDDDPSTPGDLTGIQSLPAEILDSFGTLSITDHGVERFFGPTGGSECLLMVDKISPRQETDDFQRHSMSLPMSQKGRIFSKDFPFTPVGTMAEVRAEIESQYMPNWERASYLTKTYCEQAAWILHGVSREQIMEELLPTYYPNGPFKAMDETKHAHDLALLFLIFAMGALVDIGQQSGNEEAEHYHQIARATIYLQPVLEKPSIVTIQALQLLGLYNAMSGNELNAEDASMETTWSLVILAAHLSQTVYLDGMRWGLPYKLVHRRRLVFWGLFVSDVWQSLSTGRPPSFSLPYIDCQFPENGHTRGKPDDPDVLCECPSSRSISFAFSAAIVFGTIVTRGPRSPLADNAIKELDAACVLFKKAARQNRRAAKALLILTQLSEKAHHALAAAQKDEGSDQLGQQWTVGAEVEDELVIFAGRTRFVSTQRLPDTKQVSDGMPGAASSSVGPQTNLSEHPVAHSYGLEAPTPSVDSRAHADPDDVRYQSRPPPEYANEGVQPQMMTQWPPQSHYPYAFEHHQSHPPLSVPQHPPSVPQHPPAPQHPSHEHASATDAPPTYPWSSPPTHFHSFNFSSSSSYSPSFPPYEQSAYHPAQSEHQVPPAPPELTELGLVSHESRLDELWTSFMRDEGYFDGFWDGW
ncbi:hypothetical protein PAXINDRAFT_66458 [Paxillus involutus ATCC 200175]|nr:hypothetical protein PAXINDRAFT_66458 [Paxillus involutus ATCC 200175]